MRRITVFFLFTILFSTGNKAQNSYVTFSASGESTVLDSVQATNLKTKESITFPGDGTLTLVNSTGISDLVSNGSPILFFPNPSPGESELICSQTVGGHVMVFIRNLTGQEIARKSEFLGAGNHSFHIQLKETGVFLIEFHGSCGQEFIKIVCTRGYGINRISYSPYSDLPKSMSQAKITHQNSEYILSHTPGDNILYKGMSGEYTTILMRSTDASQNYEFDFVGGIISEDLAYRTVKIGDQIWMAENLAYLPTVHDPGDGSEESPFYYVYSYEGQSVSAAKATDYYETFGVLYNWEAAKSACPADWHLPSDEEWKALERYLGMSSSAADSASWRASGDVATQLKTAIGWDGDNSSGFTALPGGLRYFEIYNGEFFHHAGNDAFFWSSSGIDSSQAWSRYFGEQGGSVNRDPSLRSNGFSVRCLKN